MSKNFVVVGLGKTGISCVRYLTAKGCQVAVTDSRANPPELGELQKNFPDVKVALGGFSAELLAQADEIIISTGVSLKEPAIAAQIAKGTPALGDIELFTARSQSAYHRYHRFQWKNNRHHFNGIDGERSVIAWNVRRYSVRLFSIS